MHLPSRQRLCAGAALLIPVLVFSCPYLFSTHCLAGGDYEDFYRPHAAWAREALAQDGAVLWWNSRMFGGTPYYGDFEGADPYAWPPAWLFLFLAPDAAHEIIITLHILLATVGLYRLLRHYRVSRAGAAIGGIAYGLSFMTVGRVSTGHLGSYIAMTLAPFVILMLHRLLARPGPARIAAFAGTVACAVVSGQPPFIAHLALASVFIVLGWSLARFRRGERWFVPSMSVLGAALLGALLAAVYLLPAAEVALHAIRSPAVSSYAGPPPRHHAFVFANFIYFLVPHFPWSGEAAALMQRDYWHEKGVYIGILPLLCAGTAIFVGGKPGIRLLALLGLAALLDAMARDLPFHSMLAAVVPGYSSFRVPCRSVWMTVLCLACLAGFGWDILRERDGRSTILLFVAATLLPAAAAVIAFLLKAPAEAGLMLGLAAMASLVLRRSGRWAVVGAVVLVSADLLAAGLPQLPLVAPGSMDAPPWYSSHIKSAPRDYRVLNLVRSDLSSTLHGFRQLGGYGHPLVAGLERYYGGAWEGYSPMGPAPLYAGTRVKRPEVLDTLNVGWIVSQRRLSDDWVEIARNGDEVLFRNPTPRRAAFLLDSGTVALSRSSNRISVRCTAEGPTRLVVSEAWMPGWKAEIGGRPVPVMPYEGALLSVDVPAVDVTVNFTYAPTVLPLGLGLSGAGLAILAVLLVVALRRDHLR